MGAGRLVVEGKYVSVATWKCLWPGHSPQSEVVMAGNTGGHGRGQFLHATKDYRIESLWCSGGTEMVVTNWAEPPESNCACHPLLNYVKDPESRQTDRESTVSDTDAPSPIIVEDRIRPLLDDAPALAISTDTIGVHPDAHTIKVFAPSAGLGETADLVLVTRDKKPDAVAGFTLPPGEPDKGKPLIEFPAELLVGGLTGLLIGGAPPDGGDAPVHYVTFDGPSGDPETPQPKTGIRSITGTDGGPTTLRSFQNKTAPVIVNTHGLPPDATIAVGKAGENGADPTLAGTQITDLVILQEDETGQPVRQSHLGRFEGKGLSTLTPENAIVGAYDPVTGKWDVDTIVPLADVMPVPEWAPATGIYTSPLTIDPRDVKPGQEFNVEAAPPPAGALARAMNLTERLLMEIGVTDLFIRGKLVDSRPWKQGPARGKGVAHEGDEQIPVSARPRFLGGEEALASVNKEYEMIEQRTDPALDKLPDSLKKKFRDNAEHSRLSATKLVSP